MLELARARAVAAMVTTIPGISTTDAIFIVRQLQEKYLEKKKELWMAFIDLKKAFDGVPREVIWWALKPLRELGVEEGMISVIKSMYIGTMTAVKIGGRESGKFSVRVGVHQGSVLSPFLFIIFLEALSKNFGKDYHMNCTQTIWFL